MNKRVAKKVLAKKDKLNYTEGQIKRATVKSESVAKRSK